MVNVLTRTPQPETTFLSILNDAIELHKRRTGKDIRKLNTKDPHLRALAQCQTSADARPVFDDMLGLLHPKLLTNKLSTLLEILLIFNDTAAELATSLGTPAGKSILVAFGIVLKTIKSKHNRAECIEKILDKLLHFMKRFQLREKTSSFAHNVDLMITIFAST